MRFLGFLGNSRLALAREVLPAAVQAWREQWCFSAEPTRGSVACDEEKALMELPQPAAAQWQQARTDAGVLHLAGSTPDAWGKMVFGPHATHVPDDATASHLLMQARLALANTLLERLGHGPVHSLSSQAPVAPGAELGSRALLRITLGEASLYCLLQANLMDQALPASSPLGQLVERRQAIGKARVRLHLHLPLTDLALGDINDLSPGDVLRARAHLDQPLALATDQGDTLAKGYLARSEGHLALQLTN